MGTGRSPCQSFPQRHHGLPGPVSIETAGLVRLPCQEQVRQAEVRVNAPRLHPGEGALARPNQYLEVFLVDGFPFPNPLEYRVTGKHENRRDGPRQRKIEQTSADEHGENRDGGPLRET